MTDFADKSAPGLFNVILKSILREDPRLSEDHRALQEKRTVVLLYIIAYFRYFCPIFKMHLKYRSPKRS